MPVRKESLNKADDVLEAVVNNIFLHRDLSCAATWMQAFEKVNELSLAEGDYWYKWTVALVKNRASAIHRELTKQKDEHLLKTYLEEWKLFKTACERLNVLFRPLLQPCPATYEDTWPMHQLVRDDFNYLGDAYLKDILIQTKMVDKIVALILEDIQALRKGFLPSGRKDTAKEVLETFRNQGGNHLIYGQVKEMLVKGLEQFYQEYFKNLENEKHSFAEYLENAKLLRDKENNWCDQLTCPEALKFVESYFKEFLKKHVMERMLRESNEIPTEDLANQLKALFGFFRGNFEDQLLPTTRMVITRLISSSFKDGDDLEGLFEMRRKLCKMITSAFNGNHCSAVEMLECEVKSVASTLDQSKLSKKLAAFCHSALVRSDAISEEEAEERLHFSHVLSSLMMEKGIFQQYYVFYLSKRHLGGLFRAIDWEEKMVQRLDGIWSKHFVRKLRAMVADCKATDGMTCFSDPEECSVVSTFKAIRTCIWPVESTVEPCNLPPIIGNIAKAYEQGYNLAFKQRKLFWHATLSKGEIRLNYLDKPYDVHANTFQMAVLLLFETRDSLRIEEIEKALSTPHETLVRQLECLLESRLLVCKTKVVLDASLISLNLQYRSDRQRVKIPKSRRNKAPCPKGLEKSVQEDRRVFIDAACVRVMKKNSVLSRTELVSQVQAIGKGRYSIEVAMVDESIRRLMDKDYLTKTSDGKYKYIC